nr:rep protein [Cressdnaviricota sp.]
MNAGQVYTDGLAGRHRAWVFTSFKDEPPSFPHKFLCYQRESCASSGRLHWQAYVIFRNGKSFAECKRLLPEAHWEPRKGSHQDALNYCTKLETRFTDPVISGDAPAQGKRNDLEVVLDSVRQGKTLVELVCDHPSSFIKYHKGIDRVRCLLAPRRQEKTKVIVLFGETGCGKSRWAHERYPGAYTKDPTEWWDGYDGHDTVILDEFYGQITIAYMLKLMDRYPLNVQVKGGYVNFSAKTLIITSNQSPTSWYKNVEHDWKPQFFRRFDEVYKYIDGRWWQSLCPTAPYNYDSILFWTVLTDLP